MQSVRARRSASSRVEGNCGASAKDIDAGAADTRPKNGFQLWAMRREAREADLLGELEDLAARVARRRSRRRRLRGRWRVAGGSNDRSLTFGARVACAKRARHDAARSRVKLVEAARVRSARGMRKHPVGLRDGARVRSEYRERVRVRPCRSSDLLSSRLAPHVADRGIALSTPAA